MDRREFMRLAAGLAAGAALPLASCSSEPTTCGLGSAGDTDRLQAAIGRPLRYERIFHRTELFPNDEERRAWAAGRLPVSSFKTLNDDGSTIAFADVAAGAADDHLRRLAAAIRARGARPMLLLYFPEPEDDVGDAPEDFAPAFRHVREVMGDLGGDIQWAHTLSHGTYDDGDGDLYYPGDDYVDCITCDGYNWCPEAGHGTEKESFAKLFAATNRFAKEKGKVWYATEVGTWDDPSPGWDKASWIEGMGRTAKRWPGLRGIMWFEHDTDEGFLCDWKIAGDPDAVDAFAALARDPYFAARGS
jgi:hypothetical protein